MGRHAAVNIEFLSYLVFYNYSVFVAISCLTLFYFLIYCVNSIPLEMSGWDIHFPFKMAVSSPKIVVDNLFYQLITK